MSQTKDKTNLGRRRLEQEIMENTSPNETNTQQNVIETTNDAFANNHVPLNLMETTNYVEFNEGTQPKFAEIYEFDSSNDNSYEISTSPEGGSIYYISHNVFPIIRIVKIKPTSSNTVDLPQNRNNTTNQTEVDSNPQLTFSELTESDSSSDGLFKESIASPKNGPHYIITYNKFPKIIIQKIIIPQNPIVTNEVEVDIQTTPETTDESDMETTDTTDTTDSCSTLSQSEETHPQPRKSTRKRKSTESDDFIYDFLDEKYFDDTIPIKRCSPLRNPSQVETSQEFENWKIDSNKPTTSRQPNDVESYYQESERKTINIIPSTSNHTEELQPLREIMRWKNKNNNPDEFTYATSRTLYPASMDENLYEEHSHEVCHQPECFGGSPQQVAHQPEEDIDWRSFCYSRQRDDKHCDPFYSRIEKINPFFSRESNDSNDSGVGSCCFTEERNSSASSSTKFTKERQSSSQKSTPFCFNTCTKPMEESLLVGCASSTCKIKFFHMDCVGLLLRPRVWICRYCKNIRH